MIKIGELAKICNVSIQTLRYYDKTGIFCADFVDESSGYRYYNPEKIQIYQQIKHLKKLNFSLEEIKEFLAASDSDRTTLYGKKKRELEESIRSQSEKIKQIDFACLDKQKGILPLNQQILEIPFEDDPQVIGKWQYCGDLPSGKRFDGENCLLKYENLMDTVFFLPGGVRIWTYFWTKGILYIVLHEKNILVPNEYTVFDYNGSTYMTLNWMVDKCLKKHAEDRTLVYRKIDSKSYTVKDTYLFTDDTNKPFVPDERVLGKWEAFDLIRRVEDFSITPKLKDRTRLFIKGMEFFDRGRCWKIGYAQQYSYTKGFVLDTFHGYAEHYELRNIDGEDYLIVEHKSADYLYLGKVFCYYVFRRKKL